MTPKKAFSDWLNFLIAAPSVIDHSFEAMEHTLLRMTQQAKDALVRSTEKLVHSNAELKAVQEQTGTDPVYKLAIEVCRQRAGGAAGKGVRAAC